MNRIENFDGIEELKKLNENGAVIQSNTKMAMLKGNTEDIAFAFERICEALKAASIPKEVVERIVDIAFSEEIICKKCGNKDKSKDAKFCRKCGNKL